MGKRYKKKPLKKMSAKKLALKAVRAVNKMDKEEETKWVDTTFTVNIDGAPAFCEPFTSTATNNAVLPLTLVKPRQSINISVLPAPPPSTINTSNYRDGAKIYVSGLYLKAQFYWPQIRDSTVSRYPPYANISWAVVREIKNNAAVDPYSAPLYPKPADVWQIPDQFSQTQVLWNQQEAPLASLLFRNMNNGNNFKILRKGNFCLAAPVMTQQGPATTLPANAAMSSFGTNPTQLTQTLPHQFSNNSVKTLNIKLHPKLRVRYRQLPEDPSQQGSGLSDNYIVPLENGIYFMYWCDVGSNNQDSRFYSQSTATYDIVKPQLVMNERLRFKDA